VVKLSYNPSPADQKVLFANDVNPVVTSSSDGTFLLGDKTLLGQQSALNSIGVRKLFNVLKISLAKASKVLLFEQNDEFSQARFKSIVDPFLRDVQGRGGIRNFSVVCDDTNNTDQVKNSYQFVGDIYIVPARSIRTIHLNFVATNNIPEFTEAA
jgi:phage tail sheath protein FI